MRRKERLAAQGAALHALDPMARLRSGYTVTLNAAGQTLRSAAQVEPGQLVRTRFADGIVQSRVESVSLSSED